MDSKVTISEDLDVHSEAIFSLAAQICLSEVHAAKLHSELQVAHDEYSLIKLTRSTINPPN